ncbi:hypothetical protein ASD00_32135 [Ensifer sp. Root31]|uniref:ABC transporter permease n=1 Tax=Ensifer sp. Root31 TaxID=1736512 RepID=UPI00070D66B8|nr:ABC transporter permease [Ensifer sp. Root31]KQU85642.1 hypothetical protein ASD00_32135 [Ensifer sp. Root31]
MAKGSNMCRAGFRNAGIFPLLIVIASASMAVVEPRFFSPLNILNVARNASFLTILALGQMLVIVVGGFDISIGATVALSSVVAALAMGHIAQAMQFSDIMVVVAGGLCGLGVGAIVGLLNGVLVSRLKIVPFMVTLGMTSIVLGLAFYLTNGVPIYGMPDIFMNVVGRGTALGLSYPIWVAVICAAFLYVVMERTPFGRHVYAVGGNPHAAWASGVRQERVLLFAYGFAGFAAGLVGLLMTARIGSGQATLDGTLALESIAAAIVGGASLSGGVGRVGRVVWSALFLTILSNIFNLARIDSRYHTLFLGVVVLSAVLIELRLRREAKHG